MNPIEHSSKWLEAGVEALKKELPELSDEAHAIASRLTELLYERVPRELRQELGDADGVLGIFGREEPADASVGYCTFLERSHQAIACAKWTGTGDEVEKVARLATNCFLKAAGRAMTEEARAHLRQSLPHEIQERMGLQRVGG